MQNQKTPTWKTITALGIPVGLLLLLAAAVVKDLSIQAVEQQEQLSTILMLAGAVLTLACLITNIRSVIRIFRLRKTAVRANMLLLVGLSVGLAGLICYISTRRFTRIDMTGQREHSLHSKTRRMLRSLDESLSITVVYNLANREVQMVWRDRVSSMLEQFKAINSNIKVKEYNYPNEADRIPKRIATRIEGGHKTFAFFEIGDSSELVPYAKTMKAVQNRRGTQRFLVESAFATALAKITAQEQSLVCVLTGHGERPTGDQDETQSTARASREQQQFGQDRYSLSILVDRLKGDNFKVKTLNLAAGDTIPDNCRAIIIPGPRTPPFSEEETKRIDAYLEQDNGRLLAMTDPDAITSSGTNLGALASLLGSYGIRPRVEAVGMQEMPGLAISDGGLVRTTTSEQSVNVKSDGYAEHPVTSDLTNYAIGFSQPCPLQIARGRPKPEIEVQKLLTGVSGSWGETDLGDNPKKASFDEDSDVRGPIVLAAVAQPAPPGQRGPRQSQPDASDLEGPRVIVVGSSFSFTNAAVEQNPPNLYFMQNAVNWLAGKTHMLGIPPKDINLNLATLSEAQVHASRWIFIGILPGIIIVIGIMVWQIRKR